MATTIYFNGRVTSIPGSYSEVDASGLASVGLGASGIVACIGEAEGAEPAVVHSVSNPGKVSKLFKSGDLLEAGQILFDPSKDPDIPGGAQEVKFVKVNPATQSSLTLSNSDGNSVVFTSKDYGKFTEKISIDVATGTSGGKAVTVTSGADVEVFDDLGAGGVFDLLYSGPMTMTASLSSSAFSAAATTTVAGKVSEYDGTFSNAGLDSQITGQPSTANPVDLVSASGSDTTQTVTVFGALSGTPVTETVTLNGTTPVSTSGNFDAVYGFLLSAACAGNVSGTENTVGTALVTITASATTAGLLDMAANPLESASAKIQVAADAASTDKLLVVGTAVSGGSGTAELVTLAGTTQQTTTKKWNDIQYIALGAVAAARTVTFEGRLLDHATVNVVSTAAGDTARSVVLYGLDVAGAVQSETVALDSSDATTPVASTGSFSRLLGIELDAAASGNVSVSSTLKGVKAYTITAGGTTAGFSKFSTAAAPDGTVNYSIPATTTATKALVVGTDSTGAAAMEILDLTSAASGTTSTSWATITGIANGHTGSTLTLTFTPFSLSTTTYDTFDDLEDYFGARTNWSVTKLVGSASTAVKIADLDRFSGVSVPSGSTGYRVLSVLGEMVSTVTAGSTFVKAVAASGATGAPNNTSSSQFLSGGVEGTTAFSNWQAALDLLRDHRVNTIVVMTTDAAVHAAVVSHCTYMCGAGRSERDCFLGSASATNFSDSKSQALSLNTRHARYFIQDVDRYNTAGAKERFAPPFTACVAAGMQAGSEVGTSLTFKYLNVLEFYGHDASYTIQDDAHELIQSGLCVIEKVPNVGFRWLRNVTTHLIDDNLAYIEGSVNEAVNYSVYNFRTSMEAMIGKKGFAGTVTAAQGIAVSILGQLIAARVITSYQNLTIELSNDVMTIDVELAPVIPINFVKTTIHLVSASFASE